MKKVLFFLVAGSFIVFSCKKDEVTPALPFNEQLSIDSTAVENYFITNGITDVLKDCNTVIVPIGEICNGYVSYVLHEEGTGLTPPNLNVDILVSYTGRLMDTGEEFDANDTIEFRLANLISGWQAVLLDMQEGDSVTMYIPSGFAYGYKKETTNGIPSNANLIFEMKLHQVN